MIDRTEPGIGSASHLATSARGRPRPARDGCGDRRAAGGTSRGRLPWEAQAERTGGPRELGAPGVRREAPCVGVAGRPSGAARQGAGLSGRTAPRLEWLTRQAGHSRKWSACRGSTCGARWWWAQVVRVSAAERASPECPCGPRCIPRLPHTASSAASQRRRAKLGGTQGPEVATRQRIAEPGSGRRRPFPAERRVFAPCKGLRCRRMAAAEWP